MNKVFEGVTHRLKEKPLLNSVGKWVFRGACLAVGVYLYNWGIYWFDQQQSIARSETLNSCLLIRNRCDGGEVDPVLEVDGIRCYCRQKEVP